MADIVKTNVVRIDLAKTGLVRNYQPVCIGEGDSYANAFGVEVVRDGQPVDLTGVNVTAYFIRPNRSTVVINGGLVEEGNIASVTLPQACYAYDGVFSLAIKLTGDSVTGTVRIVDGAVVNTTEGPTIDPGSVVPTLDELLAKIDACETATAAAIEATEATEAAISKTEHLLDTSETTAWNQIVPNGNFASTSGWQKYSNHTLSVSNNEITLTVSSSSTRSRIYREDLPTTTVGHKLYAHAEMMASENAQPLYLRVGGEDIKKSGYDADTWYVIDDVIDASAESAVITLAYGADNSHRLPTGGTLSARNVWATDLTAIYGEGNEPTLAESRQLYPHRYYDYATIGSVRNIDIAEVHGAQIAELSERMGSAEDAIDALESTKADKSALAYTDERLDVLWKLTHGVAWDTVADNADGYAKTVPEGVHMTEVGMWGGHSDVVGGEILSADVVSIDTVGKNLYTGWGNTFPIGVGTYYYSSADTPGCTRADFAFFDANGDNVVDGITVGDAYLSTNFFRLSDNKTILHDTIIISNPSVRSMKIYGGLGSYLPYNDVQVEAGSAQTAYKPHHDEQHPIPSAVLAQYPLHSAGSVYDTISWDGQKWWHTQNTDSHSFAYSDFTQHDSGTNTVRYRAGVTGAKASGSNGICNNNTFVTSGVSADQELCGIVSERLYYRVPVGMSQQALEDRLNAVEIVYELATPVVTDITDLMQDWHGELPTEGGGTITFAQQGDTIFPVPNHLNHYRNLSEVN